MGIGMAEMTANEVYMLQLINRARLDPLAEAQRLGIDLNQGLAPGRLDGAARQPLSPADLLVDASRTHSTWMLDTDIFAHEGAGGSSAGDRMTAAGYSFTGSWTWGENISWSGTTGSLGSLKAYVEQQHDGLFVSPGHRTNILNASFREIGIGQITGVFTKDGTGWNASMITQNFATSGTSRFLTGVVFDDADGDNFYDPGEGLGGVAITLGGAVLATTAASGQYTMALGDGSHQLRFAGGGLAGTYDTQVVMAGANVQVNPEASQFAIPLPVASIGADQAVSEAAVRITFIVTLNAAPSAPASVQWRLDGGTATVADKDMPAGQGGTLVFAPGGPLSQAFTLLVNDEAYKQEGSEHFSVVLHDTAGLALGRGAASVVLDDNYIAPPAVPLAMTNTTTQGSNTPAAAAYAGPLGYLAGEFVYLGTDSISVMANAPNMFLRSGSGDDALAVTAGQNVLDAGTGSNFLTGGSGADTFFLDARGATMPIWSTVVGLSAGDAVTLWGVTPADFAIEWFEGQGAAGYTGLTMHATAAGRHNVSLTLASYADADRTGGRLSVLHGNDPASGSDYMYIFAHP